MPNPVTITQIAEAAGVSTATVDRVLNNRPGVNPTTVHKVREAMAALGGGRAGARAPALHVELPLRLRAAGRRGAASSTWSTASSRRRRASSATSTSPRSRTACRWPMPTCAPPSSPSCTDLDGIALLAPDVPQVKLAINELVRAGVHVVTLFSDVPGSMRETAIGADNRAAGRTAGLLLGRSLPREQRRRVRTVFAGHALCGRDRPPHRLPAGARGALSARAGAAPVRAAGIGGRGFRIRARDAGPEATRRPPCRRSTTSGPCSFGIARALAEHGYGHELMFVAHDLLEVHRSMLISGALGYVLHQDVYYAVTAASRVLRALCDGVRGALTAINNPRVEILTAENLA